MDLDLRAKYLKEYFYEEKIYMAFIHGRFFLGKLETVNPRKDDAMNMLKDIRKFDIPISDFNIYVKFQTDLKISQTYKNIL